MKKIVTISIVITLLLLLMTLIVGCQEKPPPQLEPTPAPSTVPTPTPTPEPTTTPEPQPVPTPVPSVPEPKPVPAPTPLESVSIMPIEIAAGETQQLEVMATDEKGNQISEFDMAWKMIDKGAGSVTETGLFTASEVARSFTDAVEVEVTQGDVIRTAVASITVTPGLLEQVVIAPDLAEIGIEMTQQFVAVGADRYGNRIPDLAFSWSVENGGGTIDETGLFTAGATSGNYTDAVKVEAAQGDITSSVTADVIVEPDRIVLMSTLENDRRDIYIINADSSNVKNLLSTNAKEFKFLCSPDGRHIVYDSGGTHGKIMVMNDDGSGKLCLIEDDEENDYRYHAWSPDGTLIILSSHNDKEDNSDIYVVDADGGNLTQLTDTSDCDESNPAWSPNGTKIMFSLYNDEDEDWDIYVMDADGGNLTQLTDTSDYDEFSPEWSPDGTQIVFSSCSHEDYVEGYLWGTLGLGLVRIMGSDIYVMDADGGNLTQLTGSRHSEINPDWSPDGTQIMYTVHGATSVESWVMNADGSDQKKSSFGLGYKISPDGSQIAFTSKDGIYVINADMTNKRRLAKNKEMIGCGAPTWSPDGSKIVFISTEYKMALRSSGPPGFGTTYSEKVPKQSEIYVIDDDGCNKVSLTANLDGAVSSPQWVPRKSGVEVTEESVIIPAPAP